MINNNNNITMMVSSKIKTRRIMVEINVLQEIQWAKPLKMKTI